MLVFTHLLIQLQCLRTVTAFISFDLLTDALYWGWQDEGASGVYLPTGDLLLFAGGVVFILAASWWNARLNHRNGGAGRSRGAPRFTTVPLTPYHKSAVTRAFRGPDYWALMKGADVVFYVFETGPARCLQVATDRPAPRPLPVVLSPSPPSARPASVQDHLVFDKTSEHSMAIDMIG